MALDHPGRQPFRNQDESYRFSQHLVDVLDLAEGALVTRPVPVFPPSTCPPRSPLIPRPAQWNAPSGFTIWATGHCSCQPM